MYINDMGDAVEKDSFVTISNECSTEYVEKKSVFIASAHVVEREDDIIRIIDEIKRKYSDATHHCYAYTLKNVQRFNDDGEPSGTAGMPILNVIEKLGLSNTLVVVTRYFGGIKLGAGGLVRAYSASAANVLTQAGKSVYVKGSKGTVEVDYDDYNTVERLLKSLGCDITDKVFDKGVVITFTTTQDWDSLTNTLVDTCRGGALCELINNVYIKETEI